MPPGCLGAPPATAPTPGIILHPNQQASLFTLRGPDAVVLQARGAAPVDSHIRRVVARACETLGIEPVHFGEYRHSFVTWASECGQEVRPKVGGLPLAAIAAVVGHHSANTTKRFYDNVKVPPMIKIPIKLEHPDDPALLPVRRAQIRLVESA